MQNALNSRERIPKKFGATYMTMNNPYFDILNDGIKEVVEANGDILITRDPAQDQQKQNEQIYEMIDEGVEAIFLNPVDWIEVEPALIACREADIPVFNVDT
jgi:monosaccharide ABC transporter substrate-binding protein, CUT2 family (TC 3.A.1.2.-)